MYFGQPLIIIKNTAVLLPQSERVST